MPQIKSQAHKRLIQLGALVNPFAFAPGDVERLSDQSVVNGNSITHFGRLITALPLGLDAARVAIFGALTGADYILHFAIIAAGMGALATL